MPIVSLRSRWTGATLIVVFARARPPTGSTSEAGPPEKNDLRPQQIFAYYGTYLSDSTSQLA